jgi:hypothetical protein
MIPPGRRSIPEKFNAVDFIDAAAGRQESQLD